MSRRQSETIVLKYARKKTLRILHRPCITPYDPIQSEEPGITTIHPTKLERQEDSASLRPLAKVSLAAGLADLEVSMKRAISTFTRITRKLRV